MSDLIPLIEAALHERKGKARGKEIDFLCPAHENTQPGPASWNRTKRAWNCLSCGASGGYLDLAKRLGIVVPEKKPRGTAQIVATYDYRDEKGNLVYQKVRLQPKDFRLRRPDGNGGWIYNMEGTRRVLYRLVEMEQNSQEVVWLVEGEKDADSLSQRGLIATTSPDGAQKGAKQKWQAHYDEWMIGRDVVILPDNDDAGRDYSTFIAQRLQGKARSIKVLALPGTQDKGDVTDWLIDGGSVGELLRLAAAAPEWAAAANREENINGFPLTDAGNGELFAYLYGDRVRYDWLRGRWLVWGRHRWQPDPNGELFRLAKEAARSRWRAAADEDSARRDDIAKWAKASESGAKIAAAIQLARAEHPIADDGAGWDTQPMLMACDNGIINLVTGELRDGKPEDRITMGSPVAYDPKAECPRFVRFLEEVQPNEAIRSWLIRWLGYCLTGMTREQLWVLCYGTGANGKGTLFDVLRWVMGDYAGVMSFATIEKGKEQAVATDMAALFGKRLVITSETQEHSQFNEARIKSLTGEDPITARELYQRQFTFEPVLKLMIGVNHKPVVKDDSHGFWRRVILDPFTETFDDARRDDNLRENLKTELPGILAFLVRAAMDWAKHGLGETPPALAVATVEYQVENDDFGPFITERCVVTPEAWALAAAMYRAYKGWASQQGMGEKEMMTSTTFGRRMGERYKKVRKNTGMEYFGIGLRGGEWEENPTPSVGSDRYEVYSVYPVSSSEPALEPREGGLPKPTSNPTHPTLAHCGNDDCEQPHWLWKDGTRRHEQRPERDGV